MSTRNIASLTLTFLLAAALGCQSSPVAPTTQPDPSAASTEPQETPSPHQCLGYYCLTIDTQEMKAAIEPARSADWHLNVTGILNTTLGVSVAMVPGESNPAAGLFVLDITLAHPFPAKPQFAGFDVKGILITPGTMTGIGSLVFADVDETRLENADGWTRWWNPTEFPAPGMFGYIQGKLASTPAIQLTATVNPYKCFADVLGPQDTPDMLFDVPVDDDLGRAVFRPGSTNTRRYRIRFPMNPGPIVKYGYAVDACWKAPSPNPPTEIPDDFPIEANQPEAYYACVYSPISSLYYDSESGRGGGVLWVGADVKDWQGEASGNPDDEIDSLKVWSPSIFSGGMPLDFIMEDSGFATYYKKLWPEPNPTQAGDFLLGWQIKSKNGPAYKQGSQPAPDDYISEWQVSEVTVIDPECADDSNNSWDEAESLYPYGGTAIGTLCKIEDQADWFKMNIGPHYQASGVIRFYHDAGTQDLFMYDEDGNQIAVGTTSDGYTEIDWTGTPLYAGWYHIELRCADDVGAFQYLLYANVTLTDITPEPTEVTPPRLDCGPSWVSAFGIGMNYVYMAGAGGTWCGYSQSSPVASYVLSRVRDVALGQVATRSGRIYYTEDMTTSPFGVDLDDYYQAASPVHYEDVLTFDNQVRAITMNTEDLYVAVAEGGVTQIYIYNWVNDPAHPALLGSFSADSHCQAIELLDPQGSNTRLVNMTFLGLQVYNVEDPSNVIYLDGSFMADGVNLSLATDENFMVKTYLDAAYDPYFEALFVDPVSGDVSSWGTYYFSNGAGFVESSQGRYAYVSTGNGIRILDYMDSFNFQEVGSFDPVGGVSAMDLKFGSLCIGSMYSGFTVYDTTDPGPENPSLVGRTTNTLNNPRGAVFRQGLGLFVDGDGPYGAIKVVDVDPPQSAFVKKEVLLTGAPYCTDCDGNKLAIGSYADHKMWLYDISDPENPSAAFAMSYTAGVTAIEITSAALYVARTNNMLRTYDVSSFPAIVPKDDVALPGNVTRMIVHGNYLYAHVSDTYGFEIYDLTNKYTPVNVGSWSTSSKVQDMALGSYFFNDYLYVCSTDELVICSIDDPGSPSEISSMPHPYPMWRMAVDGQLGFVCSMTTTPAVYSLYPPNGPQNLGEPFGAPYASYNWGMLVNDDYLYLMQQFIGLRVFDLHP